MFFQGIAEEQKIPCPQDEVQLFSLFVLEMQLYYSSSIAHQLKNIAKITRFYDELIKLSLQEFISSKHVNSSYLLECYQNIREAFVKKCFELDILKHYGSKGVVLTGFSKIANSRLPKLPFFKKELNNILRGKIIKKVLMNIKSSRITKH